MKTVSIDIQIPDGYEVAEGLPRTPKEGEYYYNMRKEGVSQCTGPWHSASGVAFILCKSAPEYDTKYINAMDGTLNLVKYVEIKALEDALLCAEPQGRVTKEDRDELLKALKALVEVTDEH